MKKRVMKKMVASFVVLASIVFAGCQLDAGVNGGINGQIGGGTIGGGIDVNGGITVGNPR